RVNHFAADGSFVNAFGWGVLNGASEPQVCTTGTGCLPGVGPASPESYAGECQLGGLTRPVTVGPGGNVFVAVTTGPEGGGTNPKFTAKVEKFSPAGACLGETVLWSETSGRAGTLAVDAAEDAYVVSAKYDLATPE